VIGSTVISQSGLEKQAGSVTAQLSPPRPELLTMVYNVADLVVPVQKVVSRPDKIDSAFYRLIENLQPMWKMAEPYRFPRQFGR